MFARIVSALVASLRAIGRVLGRIATAPFRFVNGLIGDGDPAMPPAPAVSAEADDAPAPAQDLESVYEQVALQVMQWCVDSLVAAGPAPIPPRMPRSIAEWLRGLSREECIGIGSADRTAVSAHFRGYELIQGVRRVRPLDRAEWPPEPALESGPGEMFSDRAGEEIAPSSVGPAAP